MDETMLEIRNFLGEGYQPLIDYGEWRVAILRFLDGMQPERNDTMERHIETDEVFVLLRGRGILILGGHDPQVNGIYPQVMDQGILYNVKRNTWHTVLLSREASVLIVENRDTGERNSEFASLSAEQHRKIISSAQAEEMD